MIHLNRLTTGERIAGISAIVLFLSMFFDWFVVRIPGSTGVRFFVDGAGQSAWDSLDYIPIALSIAIVASLGAVAWRLVAPVEEFPVRANRLVTILGIVSALLICFRIIDPPNIGSFHGIFGRTVSAERTVEFGIFIGLIGAAGIAFGGYRAMGEEGRQSNPHPDTG